MRCLSIAALASLSLSLASPASAEEAPAAPQPAPKWYDTFEIHGLVDTYWSGNPGQPQARSNALRLFEGNNGFQLSYAKLTAQMNPEPAGFRIDLGAGQTAAVLNTLSPPSSSASIGTFTVQQAYASLKLPANIVLDAGRFVTSAGAEVIEAKDNLLYSRSILFYSAIPFTHLGARLTIPIVDGLSVMAGLVNGWDNPPSPVGSTKSGLLSVLYTGPSATTLALNVIYGRINNDVQDSRLLIDVVLARAFGDLTVSVNGDFGTQSATVGGASAQQNYYGAALAARYALLGDKLRVAARVEYFGDPDGLSNPTGAGIGASYYEGTINLGLPVGKNAELRIEAREDLSTEEVLNGKKSQLVGTVAALAWF